MSVLYVVNYSLNILYIVVMSWTDDKVKKLKELWGKGSTASQIANIIGGVSRNAVIGKAHRLNLSSKITDKTIANGLSSKNNNEKFQSTEKRGRKSKFNSLIIEKNLILKRARRNSKIEVGQNLLSLKNIEEISNN